jgi:hypothetical protein
MSTHTAYIYTNRSASVFYDSVRVTDDSKHNLTEAWKYSETDKPSDEFLEVFSNRAVVECEMVRGTAGETADETRARAVSIYEAQGLERRYPRSTGRSTKSVKKAAKPFSHVSFIARNGKGLTFDRVLNLSRSSSWVLSEAAAQQVKSIALHNSQKEDCYFGGEVVGYEVVGTDSKGNTRVDFLFTGSSKYSVADKKLAWSYEQGRA